jgi:hypothetical protein
MHDSSPTCTEDALASRFNAQISTIEFDAEGRGLFHWAEGREGVEIAWNFSDPVPKKGV